MPHHQQHNHYHHWRYWFIVSLLLLAMTGVIARLVYLSVIDRHFLLSQSDARVLRKESIPSFRGMIMSANGVPLAVSTPVDSVWVNPQVFNASAAQAQQLANLLSIPVSHVEKRIHLPSAPPSRIEFSYLKRRLPPEVAKRALALKLTGLHLQREYQRYYPLAEVAAHVTGFTNINDQGQEGLELAYNQWLSGQAGKRLVLKDRMGHIIETVSLLKAAKQGRNLILSLDSRIQYLAYRVLKATVQKYDAASGSIVVLNPKTGQVVAMVNQPSYNPNNRPKDTDGRYRNRAVTDVFEPGSTMKAFSIAAALESGVYTPKSLIDTAPGRFIVDGNTIRDDGLNYGAIDVAQVMQKSSNIGVAKMTLSLPPENLIDLFKAVGFGERTRSGFPGEVSGVITTPNRWRPFILATMAFGYGVSVTPLQLAHAYAIIANDGVDMPVTFLKAAEKALKGKGNRVIKAAVAKEVMTMLEMVVEPGGTGTRAAINGYTVAGKTGTANIAGLHGYDKDRYIASFVGMAPASNPRLVVAVIIRDPKKQHFGGLVAAPAFAQVMSGALRFWNVPPDNLDHHLDVPTQGGTAAKD